MFVKLVCTGTRAGCEFTDYSFLFFWVTIFQFLVTNRAVSPANVVFDLLSIFRISSAHIAFKSEFTSSYSIRNFRLHMFLMRNNIIWKVEISNARWTPKKTSKLFRFQTLHISCSLNLFDCRVIPTKAELIRKLRFSFSFPV